MSSDLISQIREAVRMYDEERGRELTERALAQGANPLELIQEGFSKELAIIGEKFAKGELFIVDLVAAAKVVEEAMGVLRPAMEKGGLKQETLGRVLIGTVEGDIHDIGKNIVSSVLQANGFEVIDLGKDVPITRFVEKVRELKPDIVGASALLTTTILRQEDLIKALEREGLRSEVKVMIGGAACSQTWADQIGADAYGADAIDAAEKAKSLLGG